MPIMVNREKWILYKHTCDYDLIKAVALDLKNSCATDISIAEKHRMQKRLAALKLYKTRNVANKPLDAINHRINTLEFYMFGYEDANTKRFIFSPLGNLFLSHIDDEAKLKKIFTAMLFAIQFQHYANGTPASFQLYPFRLLLQLMMEPRLNYRLYSTEYAYIVAFVQSVTQESYDELVERILNFRQNDTNVICALLKEDEHTYVNCIYEWQYYTQKLLKTIGIIDVNEGRKIGKLYHPQKSTSRSAPTGRYVKTSYATIPEKLQPFISKMLHEYPATKAPLKLNDDQRMMMDVVKEIYSFYPNVLLSEIGENTDDIQVKLLKLPSLIEKYSQNPDNNTAYLFEDVLVDGFNMFINVEARKIGGAGHTDIECLYISKKKKFAVEAKSTANKLSGINAGRLRKHRNEIGGEYTIVITPRYVPAVKTDILDQPIVMVLANTFAEYLYNHIHHDVREIDYCDFDDIIINNLGNDVSKLISDMTMEKFASQ